MNKKSAAGGSAAVSAILLALAILDPIPSNILIFTMVTLGFLFSYYLT